jgi:hypothetical protein
MVSGVELRTLFGEKMRPLEGGPPPGPSSNAAVGAAFTSLRRRLGQARRATLPDTGRVSSVARWLPSIDSRADGRSQRRRRWITTAGQMYDHSGDAYTTTDGAQMHDHDGGAGLRSRRGRRCATKGEARMGSRRGPRCTTTTTAVQMHHYGGRTDGHGCTTMTTARMHDHNPSSSGEWPAGSVRAH